MVQEMTNAMATCLRVSLKLGMSNPRSVLSRVFFGVI